MIGWIPHRKSIIYKKETVVMTNFGHLSSSALDIVAIHCLRHVENVATCTRTYNYSSRTMPFGK